MSSKIKKSKKAAINSFTEMEIICPRKVQIVGLGIKGNVKKTKIEKKRNILNTVSKSVSKTQLKDQKKYSFKLAVKNLSFDVNEDDLKKIFPNANLISLPRFSNDGVIKGGASILYESKTEAKIAQKFVNRRKLKGRRISVVLKSNKDVKKTESGTSTPKKVDLYPKKAQSPIRPKIPGRQKLYTFADDSD